LTHASDRPIYIRVCVFRYGLIDIQYGVCMRTFYSIQKDVPARDD